MLLTKPNKWPQSTSFTHIHLNGESKEYVDWATGVDLVLFSRDKKTDFHKHIADWGTWKRVQKPLWNFNVPLLLPPPMLVCTTLSVRQCQMHTISIFVNSV